MRRIKRKGTIKPILCFCLTLWLSASALFLFPEALAAHPDEDAPEEILTIDLLVAAIDPYLESTDGLPYWNGLTTIRASEYFGFSMDDNLTAWCETFEEVSHGTVRFTVVGKEIIDEFPQYRSLDPLDNRSFQELFPKNADGYGDWYGGVTSEAYKPYDTFGDLDYSYYLEKLDLVNRRNNSEFDMVYLVGVDPLSPYETCMVGQNPFWVNGEGFVAPCPNFIIVTPTFSRFDGSIENVGHLAENMLGYTYGSVPYEEGVIDGNDYMALNDWQKYCLCKFTGTPDTEIFGYGMVHFSPNSEYDYDWTNPNPVLYYSDWKNGSDVEEFTPDECYMQTPPFAYRDDGCVSHHRWWFYNMPYEPGRDENGYYNNWWKYIFTPDYVTSLSAADGGEPVLRMEAGEKTPIGFQINYYSGSTYTTDTVDSHAPAAVSDPELLFYENGMFHALKDGAGTVRIAIDGKQFEFAVRIGQEETPEPTMAPTAAAPGTAAREDEPPDRAFPMAAVGGSASLIIIVLAAFLLVRRKRTR